MLGIIRNIMRQASTALLCASMLKPNMAANPIWVAVPSAVPIAMKTLCTCSSQVVDYNGLRNHTARAADLADVDVAFRN